MVHWKINGQTVSASEEVFDYIKRLEDQVDKHEQGRIKAARTVELDSEEDHF